MVHLSATGGDREADENIVYLTQVLGTGSTERPQGHVGKPPAQDAGARVGLGPSFDWGFLEKGNKAGGTV